jgi:hypothetical protein
MERMDAVDVYPREATPPYRVASRTRKRRVAPQTLVRPCGGCHFPLSRAEREHTCSSCQQSRCLACCPDALCYSCAHRAPPETFPRGCKP